MKWENYSLKEIAGYWTGKIDASIVDASNYISTDNLYQVAFIHAK